MDPNLNRLESKIDQINKRYTRERNMRWAWSAFKKTVLLAIFIWLVFKLGYIVVSLNIPEALQ